MQTASWAGKREESTLAHGSLSDERGEGAGGLEVLIGSGRAATSRPVRNTRRRHLG